MSRPTQFARSFFTLFVIASVNFAGNVPLDDLVPSDDITGSASVFVFRGSSKRPQAGIAAAKSFRSDGARSGRARARIGGQLTASRKRKSEQSRARAAALARARARERNARLRQSNILTARAEEQLGTGEIDPAIANFREALKLNARNVDAASGLSDALTVKGIETAGNNANPDAAVYLEEAVKLNEKNEIACAKLGEIYDVGGRNADAIRLYEMALTADPELSSLYLPVGLAYLEADKPTEAENFLLKAEKSGVESSELKFARGVLLVKQNREGEALSDFEAVIAAEPRNADAHYQRAMILERAGRTDDALSAYKQVVSIDETMSGAWYAIGVIYYNSGAYDESVAAYQNVLKYDPSNARAHANLASAYRQLEKYGEANAEYRAANEKGIDKDTDLYSEWGYCLGKTHEWDKAVARLNTASELSPTAVENNNVGWGYYNAGRTDKANENDEEAAKKFELAKLSLQKAVELDPQLDAAHLNLGATNNSLGDFEAAIIALNVAIGLRNNWVIALNQLGFAYRGSGNLAAAIDQFGRVTTLDASNRFGLYNLGEVYFLSGNKKDAKKIHDRLKKVDPTLASNLNDVLSGKVVLDEAKRKIQKKVPRIPRIPF